MIQTEITYCIRGFFSVSFLLFSIIALGQTDSRWWKRDVKNPADSLSVDSLIYPDTLKVYPFPISDKRGELTVNIDSAITAIDSLWKSEEKTLNGYRIQIHFGNLESARAIRAKCRKEMEISRVYLESIAPNYSVAVGDYRSRWEAELELGELKRYYPDALLIPSKINLPDLD